MSVLRWADQELDPPLGTEHFLVVGASGSGKTVLINMLLRSAFETGRAFRAMVYDPKQEILPYLYALVENTPKQVKVLNPFDWRSCAWNLVEDIDGPLSAEQFATILIPTAKSSSDGDAFFVKAARDLLKGVILTFINCVPTPNTWTFRDVILAMLYDPYLRFLLEMNQTRANEPFPNTARLYDTYLSGDPRTISNIRATINTSLAIYEPVAAVWHHAQKAGNTFSLSRWIATGSSDVLVLGNDEASRAAIDAINRAIFQRATELLLARREMKSQEKSTGDNQTWFFMDEVREAGELNGLSRLMTKGRSKGACVVLGFQDIDGLRDVYGECVAHEICGQCNNVGVLKLNSPSTATWASELFGRRLAVSHNASGSSSEKGPQGSLGTGEEERPWVYTSDLLYLPATSSIGGLHGYFRSHDLDPEENELRVHLDWETEIQTYLPIPHPHVAAKAAQNKVSMLAARIPRPVTEHYLKPWDADDWKRLGFQVAIPHWQSNLPPGGTSGSGGLPNIKKGTP